MFIDDLKIHIIENCGERELYWHDIKIMLNHEDYFDIFAQSLNIDSQNIINYLPDIENTYRFNFSYNSKFIGSVEIINEYCFIPQYRGCRVEKNYCRFLKNRYAANSFKSNKVLTETERLIKNIIE